MITIYFTLVILSVIVLSGFFIIKLDSTFILANSIYNASNKLEAKYAKLKHVSMWNEKFNVQAHFLANVAEFDNSKPIIVLLHGFSADKYIWNRTSRQLTNQYQLFIPDLLGHGDAIYRSTVNYSVSEQVRFLLDILDILNIQKFHIIGNSMGGFMAAQMLEKCPDRILKSVLIDPAGIRSESSLEMAETNQNPFKHKDETDFFYFYDLVMAKPPYLPKFMLRALAYKYIGKRDQYTHMFHDFFNTDHFFHINHKIEASNVMLVWGANDRLLPVTDAMLWQAMLNSTSVIYKDLGHMPMVEDVARVSRDIRLFLERDA